MEEYKEYKWVKKIDALASQGVNLSMGLLMMFFFIGSAAGFFDKMFR
jgi:hypothetical protein